MRRIDRRAFLKNSMYALLAFFAFLIMREKPRAKKERSFPTGTKGRYYKKLAG